METVGSDRGQRGSATDAGTASRTASGTASRTASGTASGTTSGTTSKTARRAPRRAAAVRYRRRRWHRGRPILPSRHQRLRRIIRGVLRSPVVRVALALAIAVHVRSRYDDIVERRASWGESVRVPVMVRDRSAGSLVRAADFAWKDLPRIAVASGVPRSTSDIAGRRLVSSIGVGEVVTATRLSRGPTSALRARIGEGRFAVAISVRENRPRLSSGDEVDVVDASGEIAAKRTVVVQTDGETITLSVSADDVGSLSRALGGPVLLAARGEDRR